MVIITSIIHSYLPSSRKWKRTILSAWVKSKRFPSVPRQERKKIKEKTQSLRFSKSYGCMKEVWALFKFHTASEVRIWAKSLRIVQILVRWGQLRSGEVRSLWNCLDQLRSWSFFRIYVLKVWWGQLGSCVVRCLPGYIETCEVRRLLGIVGSDEDSSGHIKSIIWRVR